MTRWHRFFLIGFLVAVMAAVMAIPPRPTTMAGWFRAALPIVAGYLGGRYLPWRRAKEKQTLAGTRRDDTITDIRP